MAWRWSDHDLMVEGVGVMESALLSAMDQAVDHGRTREAGGRRFASYLRAVARSGPAQAFAVSSGGVRLAYADIPPPMRFYWAVDPECGRCLVFLTWAWCEPDSDRDTASHQAKLLEAAERLSNVEAH